MTQSGFAAELVAGMASRALFPGYWIDRDHLMMHLVEKEKLRRANAAFLKTAVCGGLAACALGAAIYDFGRWFTALLD